MSFGSLNLSLTLGASRVVRAILTGFEYFFDDAETSQYFFDDAETLDRQVQD